MHETNNFVHQIKADIIETTDPILQFTTRTICSTDLNKNSDIPSIKNGQILWDKTFGIVAEIGNSLYLVRTN
jgi:hypothetical protein